MLWNNLKLTLYLFMLHILLFISMEEHWWNETIPGHMDDNNRYTTVSFSIASTK